MSDFNEKFLDGFYKFASKIYNKSGQGEGNKKFKKKIQNNFHLLYLKTRISFFHQLIYPWAYQHY